MYRLTRCEWPMTFIDLNISISGLHGLDQGVLYLKEIFCFRNGKVKIIYINRLTHETFSVQWNKLIHF
jgi:hypothetical protein